LKLRGDISSTSVSAGTLFQKLPNLKVAIPFDEIKYTDPSRDVGIVELPVTW
jgi:nitric oxide reductase